MLYPSGNRDEEVFERPDELRVALREILRRLPEMRFADAGPVVESHALVRACTRMEVSWNVG